MRGAERLLTWLGCESAWSQFVLLLALTDLAVAGVLVAGSAQRSSSPSFGTAREIMPMRAWGLLLGAAALAVLWRVLTRRTASWPMIAAASWHAFFATALIFAAAVDERAALTGCVLYLGRVAMHLLAAWRG